MGSKSPFLLMTMIILSIFSNQSSATKNPICNSTPSPKFCKSFLPDSPNATIHSHCRFTLQHSLSQAHEFINLIQTHLNFTSDLFFSLPLISALHDCHSLAQTNFEFILNTVETVNETCEILPFSEADQIQTLISAVITNQETCYEGLISSVSNLGSGLNLVGDVLNSISYERKLYSLYLSLFTLGWVPKNGRPKDLPEKKNHFRFRDGPLPMKMSPENRAYYDKLVHRSKPKLGRRLLQTSNADGILVNGIVAVDKNGSFDFTTISAAIAAAPNNSAAANGYFLIFVTAGVYNETVLIPKNKRYLLMIGEGNNQTTITGNNNVVDGSTTFNSATVAVEGKGFFGVNLTITNTAGAIKHQAVALRVSADLTTFYSCIFQAYQDTLYTHSLRQFYRDCDIYGTVDFIFGNAAVVFQNCNLYARLPMPGQFNALTAQGRTDINQNTGISIHNCSIKATPELAASPKTKSYLGRPWKTYARTVYMQSFIDSLIDPVGWMVWDGTLNLNTSYYAEFGNRGPGSDTSRRAQWAVGVINATVAGNFTVSSFLAGDDWLPPTTVPYTGGLIV